MAAALTALVIILFLGNVRLSLIILAAIPLSIVTAVLFINVTGQTLNTMTLGGFALADRHSRRQRHGGDREHRAARRRWTNPCIERSSTARARSRADLPLDAVHLHRLRSGLSAAGHGEIPVLAAVAVGDRRAARESRAVVHDGAGAVPMPDARRRPSIRRPRRRSARRRARAADNPVMRVHSRSRRGFSSFARATATPCLDACRSRGARSSPSSALMVLSRRSVPAAGPRLLPAGRRRADAPARARAGRAPASSRPRHCFAAGRGARSAAIVGRRSDRRDARQHRPALQRHQHRPERFGDGRPDGRRDPDFARARSTRRPRSSSRNCDASCRARFPNCSSSSSPPTSSTRCSISASRRRSTSACPGPTRSGVRARLASSRAR